VQNVFTAMLSDGTTLDVEDMKDDLAAWVEAIYTPLLGSFPTNLVFVDLDYYNLTTDTPLGTGSWPALTAGTGATTDIVGSGVCAVITAFTYVVRAHGRKFFGPLVDAALENGELNGAMMTALAGILATWITPFVGTTSGRAWAPGIWNRTLSVFRNFRDAVVRNVPGYQRRRKANVGS
jgi:hypothetical protein